MDTQAVKRLLKDVKNKKITTEEAYLKLKHLPFEDIGFAKLDNHRAIRKGFPEVIFCQGKTIPQIKEIAKRLSKNHRNVMATRADKKAFNAIRSTLKKAKYHEQARIITIGDGTKKKGSILVITGGTADIPVAEEAAVTAEFLGNNVERLYDVGVAGLHRLTGSIKKMSGADVIIVIAGMEGALASVVGGLTDKPVIAVPTSIGYGAAFKGMAALLAMLNSCAPGVAVVNIDNGFGAGCMASIINRK
ncbi:nickel pincer cofactor biosynthesis protein LarB [Candidatus Margulisiibacteriota bacterium]